MRIPSMSGDTPKEAQRSAVANRETIEEGAAFAEYVLLVGLIAVIAIVSVRILGQRISEQWSTIAARV